MNLEYLTYSIISALATLIFYLVHKDWKRNREEKAQYFVKTSTDIESIRDWFLIIVLVVCTLILLILSFFK